MRGGMDRALAFVQVRFCLIYFAITTSYLNLIGFLSQPTRNLHRNLAPTPVRPIPRPQPLIPPPRPRGGGHTRSRAPIIRAQSQLVTHNPFLLRDEDQSALAPTPATTLNPNTHTHTNNIPPSQIPFRKPSSPTRIPQPPLMR